MAVAVLSSALSTQAAIAEAQSIALPGLRGFPESLTSTVDGTLFIGRLGDGGIVRSRVTDVTVSSQPEGSVMSYSISTLLLRNLSDVFAEIDPVRRRKAIDEIWHEDGVFYDPNSGPHRGRDEIDRIAGKVKATHPDFRYQPISAPEEIGDAGRVRWVSGTPGKPPEYAGTDFLVARDGKIAAVYMFFDEIP